MEGRISEQPLAELIREISAKRLSGRLRLHQERIKVVVYFRTGDLIYAASNVRIFRLREYLIKDKLVAEDALSRFNSRRSDLAFAKQLTADGLLSERQVAQLQSRQLADVLRLALMWTEGTWDFDARPRLSEEVQFKLDWEPLLLDAARRIPLKFAASRLPNASEVVLPVNNPRQRNDLQPTEVFLLSRLDGPTSINDLVSLSGLPEAESLRLIYALALSGLLQRERWKQAFRGQGAPPAQKETESAPESAQDSQATRQPPKTDAEDLNDFLSRLANATTHYEVLNVEANSSPAIIKQSYYEVARRYHPDRFRKKSDSSLQARIESAFARITQAYDTLRDAGLRATYDSKLDSQARTRELANSAPKPVTQPRSSPATKTPSPPPVSETAKTADMPLTNVERAEQNFKEGFAAKQLGQINAAIGMLSSAAGLVPNDARYRAYYGQALAAHPNTRRMAEIELQAALKIEPNNADYRIMLAELYRDLGFAVRARSEIERVLESTPNHQKARELLRSLR